MALEKYMAIAGLVLSIFFVAEVLTLFNFMIDPSDTMIEDLKPSLVDSSVEMVPLISMGLSIPIMIVGARLLKIRPRKPKKNYLEDGDNF